MQTHKMSRDARKVFQTIDALCQKHGVQGATTPGHIYMCDMILIRFYAQPIINILKLQIGRVKNKEEKHLTFEYWIPVITNMLKNNGSAVRPNCHIPDWDVKEGDETIRSFDHIISQYLIVDYGYDDMVMLQRIVNTYSYGEIVYACMVGKGNKVHEIRYINAVLEKERAKKQIQIHRIDDLGAKIEASGHILDRPVHTHSPLDIAMAQYRWEQKRENAKIERDFADMLRRADT